MKLAKQNSKLFLCPDLLEFNVTKTRGKSSENDRHGPDKNVKYDSTVRDFPTRTRNIFGLR